MEKQEKMAPAIMISRQKRFFMFAVLPFVMLAVAVIRYRNNGSRIVVPDWDPEFACPKVFTKEELKTNYDGRGERPSYLVILGEVYDVTGSEHYKEGNGYHIFIGQDATTAFVTGKFEDGVPSDDVMLLEVGQMRGVEDWLKFYR
jgi:predicted heme/steroid binding protein